jgi:arylsulfatase A-like enzyme
MRTTALLVTVAALAASSTLARAQTPPKPNVVILLADDLGNSDLGWRGSEIKTPNIDALANAGAKLEQLYAMPVCSPTRAALLTGRYPFRYGLQTSVVKPWAAYGLPLDERTLPQALKEAGYETAIAGKWHLGHAKPEYLPMQRGFDHQYGHYNGALDYFTHERDGGHDWHRNDKANYDEGYSTTLLAKEAVTRITERDKSKPLFLYVPFTAVHGPYQVPDSYKEPYSSANRRRLNYMGMVAALDEAVGQINGALKDQGIDGNTLVIFASDNGGPDPENVTRNGDLRAGKGTMYEGGVRVVASATWPGMIPAGSTDTTPMHMVDWYPTILNLAGATLDQPKPIDGHNVMAALQGKGPRASDEIIINVTPNSGAIIRGDWKLLINGFRRIAEEAEDPTATLKRPTEYELFNMKTDRQEKRNVAAEHPEIVEQLRARYEELAKVAVPAFSEAKSPSYRVPKIWGEHEEATKAPGEAKP